MKVIAGCGLIVGAAMLAFAAAGLAGEPGTVLKADVLKAKPFSDAKTVATLAKSSKVDILQRQGGWLYVAAAKRKGWVRMLSVKRGAASGTSAGKEAAGLLTVASGRAGTGKVVATTGIRGLNEEQLKAAPYNEEEIGKLESYAVAQKDAERFAAQGKLRRQQVPLFDAAAAPAQEGR